MANFIPSYSLISDISQEQHAVVTFTDDHEFTVGEIVSFRVSQPYGMVEMNNRQATVADTTSDTITVPIDTTNFNAFVYPPSSDPQFLAMAVPAGSGIIPDQNNPVYGASPFGTTLIDRFDHVPSS